MTYIDLVTRRHPEYNLYVDFWNFLYRSYKGGYEYLNAAVIEQHLFSHRLENTTDFQKRKDRAYYLNYCKRVVDNYTNFIFAEEDAIKRSTDPELNLFFENTDGKGTEINDLMKRIGCLSSVYGRVDAIVDAPKREKDIYTLREAREGKLFPYVVLRNPIEAVDWSVDFFGNLNWVLYQYVLYDDENPYVLRDTNPSSYYKYKLITKDRWVDFNYDGTIIDIGENELKEVFVYRSLHRSDSGVLAVSQIGDIAYINREIFNWCSQVSEQISKQTFSQLVVPDDGNWDVDENSESDASMKFQRRIGTSYAFTFPKDAGQPPRYISPDKEQVEVIWEMIKSHVGEIYRLAGLSLSQADDATSGRAKQQQFVSVEASLKAKASELEKTENEILKLVRKRQGKTLSKEDMTVYPRDFDILNFSEMLDIDLKVITSGFSTILNKYLLQKIASKSCSTAPYQIKEAVKNEIEKGDGSVLVLGTGTITRVSADFDPNSISVEEESGASTLAGNVKNPSDKGEPDSVQQRNQELGEGVTKSKSRRKKNIDNKGNQNNSDTNIE